MTPAKPPSKPPSKLPLSARPAPQAAAPVARALRSAAEPAAPARRLALLGLAAGLGAVLLAAGAAYALSQLWGADGVWAASLAAALGVVAAAVPLALVFARLAPAARPEAAAPASGIVAAGGVPRPLFMDLAQREWARARRYGNGAALLLVDVDRYARLCESRGAAAGDAVLAELLRQTAPSLRPADVLTRFGESQMAVFLTPADATGALDVAERIRERAEQFEVALTGAGLGQPQRVRFTVSVGVAHLRPAHLNLQAVIDDAEDALAAARSAAGNCVRAAPVEAGRGRGPGSWRGDERRARPKQGGSAPL
jgi:diguanylate cyclase (GGDEF)-like protein